MIRVGMVCLVLNGCALAPNSIRTEIEHVSHLSQHFDGSHENMGAELAAVVAHWKLGGAYFNLSEGYNFSPADGHPCNGGICGNREVFQASVGYEFKVRP